MTTPPTAHEELADSGSHATVVVRLPTSVLADLGQKATRQGVTMSELIHDAIATHAIIHDDDGYETARHRITTAR